MISVGEIREELLTLGISEDVINTTKGKSNLMSLLEKAKNKLSENLEEFDFEKLETQTDQAEEKGVDGIPDVSYLSEDWDDYVMKHFLPKELDKGNPNVHGLRRVTEVLLGPIVTSVGTGNTVCNYIVEILWNRDFEGKSGIGDFSRTRRFSGIASATESNTDAPYSEYLEAMAETRAEVRALRKALRIKTPAAEETKNEHITQEEKIEPNNNSISSTQSSFLINNCDRLGIDYVKFVATIDNKKIEELTSDEAASLIKEINMYQQQRKELPEELKK